MNALLDIREASQTKEQGGRFDSCYGRKTKEEKFTSVIYWLFYRIEKLFYPTKNHKPTTRISPVVHCQIICREALLLFAIGEVCRNTETMSSHICILDASKFDSKIYFNTGLVARGCGSFVDIVRRCTFRGRL